MEVVKDSFGNEKEVKKDRSKENIKREVISNFNLHNLTV